MSNKPILCVDFDGVIHSYSSGWQGAATIIDPPVQGAIPWLSRAQEWWTVCVYSSRTKEPGGIKAMKEYINRYALIFFGSNSLETDKFMSALQFPEQKPAANMTIDDRAVCFEGDWLDPKLDPQELLKFKPWNKR